MENDSKTLASIIKKQFPDNNVDELSIMIDRYKNSDAWWPNTYIEKKAFERLEDLMKYNGVLDNSNYYDILVKNDFNE